MKIVHIQTEFTGYGNEPFRLHSALLNKGYDSILYNYKSILETDKIKLFRKKDNFFKKKINSFFYSWSMSAKIDGTYFYSPLPFLGHNISSYNDIQTADIILLHWTQGLFLNLKDVEHIFKLGKPVIIVLHDMWYVTGGCHHKFGCTQKYCIKCPFFDHINFSTIYQNFMKRKLYAEYKNVVFLCYSKWMYNQLVSSPFMLKNRIYILPPYIDDNVFYPRDKEISKLQLGIEKKYKVITFGSVASTTNKYKGIEYLVKALNILKRKDILVLMYGSQCVDVKLCDIPIVNLGIVSQEEQMNIINNATDAFVTSSLIESYGMTVMENLLCRTPVVAFNTSALPELIDHKKNGYLAELKNINDLANGLEYVLDNIDKDNFKSPSYHSDVVVKEYENLFNKLI